MNGWIKYFADGTKEIGIDKDVKTRKVSWSKGRLNNIKEVQIQHNSTGQWALISGPGEFWQSDTYEVAVLQSGNGQITNRTIYRKFQDGDSYMRCIEVDGCLHIVIGDYICNGEGTFFDIKSEWIGRWLELDIEIGNNVTCSIVDKPGGV